MILTNHIVHRLLKEQEFIVEICMHQRDYDIRTKGIEFAKDEMYEGLAQMLSPVKNTNYIITNTVLDKLDLFDTKQAMSIEGWEIFKHLPDFKKTLILPNNVCIRVRKRDGLLYFCHFKMTPDKSKDNYGSLYWVLLFVDMDNSRMAEHWQSKDGEALAPFLYSLMCFLELTENDTILLEPGRKHGTIKTGKVVNTLGFPVTIVNSRWNVTTILSEGFSVRGHARLQPHGPSNSLRKLIYIEPFVKNGYVRRAGSETQKHN